LWTAAAAGRSYRELIPLADVVFAGDEEAALAVGSAKSPADLAQRTAELGPAQAVIKLGSKGAVACIDGELFHQARPHQTGTRKRGRPLAGAPFAT
ncbi:MAG TPA: PfkB family carbohydrate kinase, partial [Arthrobacter sp.]|nr:PfkB family carbohydrate kinase [Arthrobacter sp.]